MTGSKTIQAIVAASMAASDAKLLRGRVYGLQRGIVTADGVNGEKDPQNRRRIRVTIPEKGVTETGWLESLNIEPYSDPPLPRVGSLVFVMFADGNPHDGVWFGSSCSGSNPASDQEDPVNDSSKAVPGDEFHAVNGDEYDLVKGDRDIETEGDYDCIVEGDLFCRTEGDYEVCTGRDQILKTDSGCELRNSRKGYLYHRDNQGAGLYVANGVALVKDRYGNQLVLGGGGVSVGAGGELSADEANEAGATFTTDFVIDLQGRNLRIVNAGDVTINGTSVTTVPHTHPNSGGGANNKGY